MADVQMPSITKAGRKMCLTGADKNKETDMSKSSRKKQLFPDDRRFVAECNVSWKNESFHVTAASLSPEQPRQP